MKLQMIELDQWCAQFFNSWRSLHDERKYNECEDLCTSFVDNLKHSYKQKQLKNKEEYTYAYIFLILAKGLQNIAELVPLTKEAYWPEDNKKTEIIWCKLWEAKERLSYFKNHWLGDDILSEIIEPLDRLESYFYDTFGVGLYFSTDIIIKKALCSICGQNIKGCEHLAGNIYGGIPCKEIVKDMLFESVSIVRSPYDMRCRIWPWNMKEDRTVTGMIMSLNTIDSFIFEE